MDRQIAILIDGSFFLKRLPKLVKPSRCNSPENIISCIRFMCRNHIKSLAGGNTPRWHKHVYRIFFYDAEPYDRRAHHPLTNRQIDFGQSDLAIDRRRLFDLLRRERSTALRLGKVTREGDWSLISPHSRKILATRSWISDLDISESAESGTIKLSESQLAEGKRLQKLWSEVGNHHVRLALRQKGVDMRIGLDIASITLKRQARTIVLVAGDSDFVPAAKFARREGVQFILDPLWQRVNPDLFEHIDGLQSGLPNPKKPKPSIMATE